MLSAIPMWVKLGIIFNFVLFVVNYTNRILVDSGAFDKYIERFIAKNPEKGYPTWLYILGFSNLAARIWFVSIIGYFIYAILF